MNNINSQCRWIILLSLLIHVNISVFAISEKIVSLQGTNSLNVSASFIGGSIMQTNNLINSGSQLNWRFSNNSDISVTLKSLQLIDGQTGTAGNIMSVNQEVEAGTSVAYTTTIGAAGIHLPVTCRFRYDYNGVEYYVDAVYSNGYTLSISSSGNGSVSYQGTTIRNTTKSFDVDKNSSATITLTPDDGYHVASLKVNGTDVTSKIASNKYTISNITSNTTVSVTFEQTPPTCTLTISASGYGSASYGGVSIRNGSQSFNINSGNSATVTFYPDDGYRVASVKVNNTDVTSQVSNNRYTISNISSNTTLAVTFEEAPVTTYRLTISASGNGSATYGGVGIRNGSQSFNINSGNSATVTFTPDDGYRIASVKVNNTDVTSQVSNNRYTISSITSNTTLAVTFEEMPEIYFTLSISASGNGSVLFRSSTIKEEEKVFPVLEGTTTTITFLPDEGYELVRLTINGTDQTSNVSNNSYTIKNIGTNIEVEATFEAIAPTTYTLSITASGGGSATYNGTSARNQTRTFTVDEGTSATISFAPDNGYRIVSLKVNNTDVTSGVVNNQYTISNITANTDVVVAYDHIKYTLSIQSGFGGSASYNGTTISNTTKSFSVSSGSSATISITPNSGYRLSKMTVNGSDVTSKVSNNQYIVSNITANTTVVIAFEVIPTTYTLSITASGNGSAIYSGTAVRNGSKSFTIEEGKSAAITFASDNGYRLASVKVNNTDVTSKVSNNQYTVSNVTANTTIVVTFEQIPIPTYTLTVSASGNGSASYGGETIRSGSKSFTINEGTNATITFTPDNGYRIASMKVNNADVTSNVSNNRYIVSNITANTTVEVVFEAIPPTTYTLSITASGNGSVNFNGSTVRNGSKSFTIEEGTNAMVSITPDNGYRIASVKVNNTDVTSNISNNQYTISNITANTSVVATFEKVPQPFSQDGINYEIESEKDHTLNVGSGEYSGHVVIPATVTHGDETWTVTGVADGAFDTPAITAITWNPPYAIGSGAFGNLTNPNLLLYVKDAAYAPANVQNVIANGWARKIVLTDAASGNDFDCPKAFTAEEISFTHHYSMTTGIGECRGWEAVALPFDVKSITHESKSGLVPFKAYYKDSPNKPFWLYQLSASGFVEAESIVAYTPYIISMPNNNHYDDIYNLSGKVTFAATNAKVDVTEQRTSKSGDKTFVPTFCSQPASDTIFPLNVDNEFFTHKDYFAEGSHFVKGSRPVCPFEAYMTTTAANAIQAIPIKDDLPTAIQNIPFSGSKEELTLRIYNLSGQAVMITDKMSLESALNRLPNGVYIVNGKKVVIK